MQIGPRQMSIAKKAAPYLEPTEQKRRFSTQIGAFLNEKTALGDGDIHTHISYSWGVTIKMTGDASLFRLRNTPPIFNNEILKRFVNEKNRRQKKYENSISSDRFFVAVFSGRKPQFRRFVGRQKRVTIELTAAAKL